MKKITICIVSLIASIEINAQTNVGVNTTNPQASLDVRGSQRIGGNLVFTHYDSATGRIQWTNSQLYVPTWQHIIRHSASTEGLYTGGGKLEYRSTTEPVFFTDWISGNAYFKNNLGIGNTTPQFPLSFNGTYGEKISLWNDGTSNHYGFRVLPSAFQIFTPTSNDDIIFGVRSASAFTESMRITGIGNVGIGVYPEYALDVKNRILLRSGGNLANSAGLWLNRTDNLEPQSFFGIENDSYVGLYADAPGWSFGMNTTNGDIKMMGRVGIGTNNPGTRLHVISGNSGGAPYGGSQLTVENNYHTYINLLSPDANETSILFGKASDAVSGGIIYNNSATMNGLQFRTNGNQTRMVINNTGKVGIGTTNPNAPLSFPPLLGKKITLYPGATGDVGLAVEGNLLQIYSDNPNADIAFGYDQAGTLHETFRLRANGALVINGSTGNAGQILQSTGPGGSPVWIDQASVKTKYYQVDIQNVAIPSGSGSFFGVGINVYSPSIVTASVSVNATSGNFSGCFDAKLSVSVERNSGGSLVASMGTFNFLCGKTTTISTGEVAVLDGSGGMLVFNPGAESIRITFTNTGDPSITIGNSNPAKILVKVTPL